MAINFSCVHCGARLQAPDGDSGQAKPCPKCGKPVKAPSAGGFTTHDSAARRQHKPQSPADDDLPGLMPEEEDANSSDELEEEDSHGDDGLGRFYGSDEKQSPVKLILAVVLLLGVIGFAAHMIINRPARDAQPDERVVRVDEKYIAENRRLTQEAMEARREGDNEKAIDLLRQVIKRMEAMPEGQRAGIERVRDDLESLETGRPAAAIRAERVRAEEEAAEQPPAEPDESEE